MSRLHFKADAVHLTGPEHGSKRSAQSEEGFLGGGAGCRGRLADLISSSSELCLVQ